MIRQCTTEAEKLHYNFAYLKEIPSMLESQFNSKNLSSNEGTSPLFLTYI